MLATNALRERWPEMRLYARMECGTTYADDAVVLRSKREGKVTTELAWHENGQTLGKRGHFPNFSMINFHGELSNGGGARDHAEEPPETVSMVTRNVNRQPLEECEPEIHTADAVTLWGSKPKMGGDDSPARLGGARPSVTPERSQRHHAPIQGRQDRVGRRSRQPRRRRLPAGELGNPRGLLMSAERSPRRAAARGAGERCAARCTRCVVVGERSRGLRGLRAPHGISNCVYECADCECGRSR